MGGREANVHEGVLVRAINELESASDGNTGIMA